MDYPIILAHGVCRFDKIWSGVLGVNNTDDPKLDHLHYFKGIRTMLIRNGFIAYHSHVGWASCIAHRAGDLKRNIQYVLDAENTEKVHIIAHSMGGLDARYMLFQDRNAGAIHRRIASLTTISTPHEGSPFADWGLKHLPRVIPVARKLGLDLTAFHDLQTHQCKAFNTDPEVIEFEDFCARHITFRTYAGRQDFWSVFDALKLPFYLVEKREGENDGLVSVKSAMWRARYFQGTIEHTDHLNELGWWDRSQDHCDESESELLSRIHAFYLDIAQGLS